MAFKAIVIGMFLFIHMQSDLHRAVIYCRSPRVSSKRVRERELQYGDRERRNATPNRKSRKGGFWD